MIGLIFQVLCIGVFASFFYKAAEADHRPPLLWALASAGLWLAAPAIGGWGFLASVASQIGLFCWWIIWKLIRKGPEQRVIR